MELSANDIGERALVKARVIYPGEAVSAGMGLQVFNELNGLLESWSLSNLMIVADVLEHFDLVAGTSEYTYGAGGTFDSARPISIRDECFIRSSNMDRRVPLVTLDVYRSRMDKSVQGEVRMMAYNPEYPLGKVFLWHAPSSIDPIYIRASKVMEKFADRTTAVGLEPGYARAIIANLAVEICPNFGKKVSAELAYVAKESMKVIKSTNSVPVKPRRASELAAMTGRGSRGNILTGPY